MNRLIVLILLLTSFSVQAGLSDMYFRASGISCAENGVRLSEGIQGSHEQLVSCFTGEVASTDEIQELENSTKDIRLELESWVYIQSSTDKILQNTKQRLSEYHKIKSDHDAGNFNPTIAQWRETHILLKTLYEQKKSYEEKQKTCSNWRFWNYAERALSDLDCDYIKSEIFDMELAATKEAIKRLESVNPVFLHPIFQASITGEEDPKPFNSVVTNFLNSSIPDLKNKQRKFRNIKKLPLSKKNIDRIMDSPKTLNEIVAVNYNPSHKFVRDDERASGYKVLTLNLGQCHVKQTLIAHEMDDILKEFGTDVALLISPFAIKGKISAVFKSAKAAHNLIKLRQARGAFVLAESAYIAVEATKLKEAENKCSAINKEMSYHSVAPEHLITKSNECKELMQSLSTSYALAVIGGTAGAKLSKFDITDIRIARAAARGKDKLLEASGAVQATIIKQSDLILEQLESMAESISPGPQLATAGDVPSNASASIVRDNPPNSTSGSSSATLGRSTTSIDDTYGLDTNTLRKFEELDCYQDGSCTNEIKSLLKGMGSLANDPKGMDGVNSILSVLRKPGYKNLTEYEIDVLKECLQVQNEKTKCSVKQFQALAKVVRYPFDPEPHPYFLKQVIRAVKYDASENIFNRITDHISSRRPKGKGTSFGEFNKVESQGGQISLNGKIYPKGSRGAMDAEGKHNENLAIKAMNELGFNINIVPESPKQRRAMGIHKQFNKLAEKEKIAANKSPDVIIDGKHLADIYSPFGGPRLDNISNMAVGILKKSEGKNFEFNVTNWSTKEKRKVTVTKTGTRQTNRVIIYGGKKPDDFEMIIKKLRDQIGASEPQHLEEAFMIIQEAGIPKMVRVWP